MLNSTGFVCVCLPLVSERMLFIECYLTFHYVDDLQPIYVKAARYDDDEEEGGDDDDGDSQDEEEEEGGDDDDDGDSQDDGDDSSSCISHIVEVAEIGELLKAMHDRINSEKVQLTSCRQLQRMVKANSWNNNYCDNIHAAGGVQYLAAAMTKYVINVDIVYSAMKTLAAIFEDADNDTCRKYPGAIDAVASVILGMNRHPNEDSIQRLGCNALSNVAFDFMCRKIADNGGINAVLNAMANHANDPYVTRDGCRMLRFMCDNDRTMQLVACYRGLKLIIDALDNHSSAACIVDVAIDILYVLAQDDDYIVRR